MIRLWKFRSVLCLRFGVRFGSYEWNASSCSVCEILRTLLLDSLLSSLSPLVRRCCCCCDGITSGLLLARHFVCSRALEPKRSICSGFDFKLIHRPLFAFFSGEIAHCVAAEAYQRPYLMHFFFLLSRFLLSESSRWWWWQNSLSPVHSCDGCGWVLKVIRLNHHPCATWYGEKSTGASARKRKNSNSSNTGKIWSNALAWVLRQQT